MQAGTIVASNYLAMAQVLGESFLQHHPDAVFTVLVVDDGDADLPDGINVVRLADLDLAPGDERMMRTIYDVMEFSTAVKPSFLRHLLTAGGGEQPACYLDPDIQVFSAFDTHIERSMQHGIVLTPHVLRPVPRDGKKIDEETIMQSGMYNCGFLAVGPTARPFLDWWDGRLRFDAVVDFERSRFTDQRWVDWVPSLFDFTIDRDPGMNVAWWNIHDRPIEIGPDGPTVDGGPVRFVHFSGYDPQQPGLLSKHQTPRPRLPHDVGTGIRTLSDEYASRLVELGHIERRRKAYPWNRSSDGVELTREVRRLVRDVALDEIARFGEIRSVPDAFDAGTDFAGWVTDRIGAPPKLATTTTGGAVDADLTIHRIVPGGDLSPRSTSDPQRTTYDVDFDWNDAHGHAVRLLLDHCEPGVVIDLGCGYAPHAEILRDAGFEYVGLDLDQPSLEHLARRDFVAHQVDLGRPEDLESSMQQALDELASDAEVAAVMALDVLEHLVQPELLLAALSSWMLQHDRAVLVTSVPNVAHRDIAAKLLAGRWDVTATGLLDHTHLRFFTDTSITRVLESAGFFETMRNDRVAYRSDQRWPAGAPTISPATPLAATVHAIRDLGDDHGDTYQLIRGYRPTVGADSTPSLIVTDPTPPAVALTVIADPSSDEAGVALLLQQLEAQTSTEWELLAREGSAEGDADRIASFDALVESASGAYVAFVERAEHVGPQWVEQFVEAMTVTVQGGAPGGDVSGQILRCGMSDDHDPATHPTSATFAFATAALRALGPGFDGLAHQAMRLRAHLLPYCGEVTTGVPAVRSEVQHTIDTWTLDTPVVDTPAGRAFRSMSELAAVVESLQRENERLRADNEWLNAELAPAPIRLVRRVLRRDASLD